MYGMFLLASMPVLIVPTCILNVWDGWMQRAHANGAGQSTTTQG